MKGYNLRKLQPEQLVRRCLYAQAIREIGSKMIEALGESFHNFLVFYEADPCEIDWEFVTFVATEHQMLGLLENFTPKPKEEEKNEPTIGMVEESVKSSLILGDTDVKSASQVAKSKEAEMKIIKG